MELQNSKWNSDRSNPVALLFLVDSELVELIYSMRCLGSSFGGSCLQSERSDKPVRVRQANRFQEILCFFLNHLPRFLEIIKLFPQDIERQ